MIVTIARVVEPDRFLHVFAGLGADKRREHGCRGARAYFDPADAHRVWCVFDWDERDYQGFLADPGIPAIARALGVEDPVVHAAPAAVVET